MISGIELHQQILYWYTQLTTSSEYKTTIYTNDQRLHSIVACTSPTQENFQNMIGDKKMKEMKMSLPVWS